MMWPPFLSSLTSAVPLSLGCVSPSSWPAMPRLGMPRNRSAMATNVIVRVPGQKFMVASIQRDGHMARRPHDSVSCFGLEVVEERLNRGRQRALVDESKADPQRVIRHGREHAVERNGLVAVENGLAERHEP